MTTQELLHRAAIALALGLLVGFQRERTHEPIGGIRTISLISLVGFTTSLLSERFGPWVLASGFFSVALLIAMGSYLKSKLDTRFLDIGITTEISMLLVFGVGAYLPFGEITYAVVVSGLMAVLLHLKRPLHGFVEKVEERGTKAIMQFVIISFVILPLLPDTDMGPYNTLNPKEVWTVVALITGISVTGYLLQKAYAGRSSAFLSGILGGLVSSTAISVSYSKRASSQKDKQTSLYAFVIFVASATAFARILAEVAFVSSQHIKALAPPLIAMLIVMTLICVGLFFINKKESEKLAESESPAEVKAAIVFACLYAVILVVSAAARERFGEQGLFIVAAIAGLTDVDAITISTAQLVSNGSVNTAVGWRVILSAALSNLLFKGAIVLVFASGRTRVASSIATLLSLCGGGLILWLWP